MPRSDADRSLEMPIQVRLIVESASGSNLCQRAALPNQLLCGGYPQSPLVARRGNTEPAVEQSYEMEAADTTQLGELMKRYVPIPILGEIIHGRCDRRIKTIRGPDRYACALRQGTGGPAEGFFSFEDALSSSY